MTCGEGWRIGGDLDIRDLSENITEGGGAFKFSLMKSRHHSEEW